MVNKLIRLTSLYVIMRGDTTGCLNAGGTAGLFIIRNLPVPEKAGMFFLGLFVVEVRSTEQSAFTDVDVIEGNVLI